MRTLPIAIFALVALTLDVRAEPPPQAVAAAPGQTVSDANANSRRALPNAAAAYVVGDTVFLDTARADTARSAASSTPVAEKGGHGLGFWAMIVLIVAAGGFLLYRWFTRKPPASTSNYRGGGGSGSGDEPRGRDGGGRAME